MPLYQYWCEKCDKGYEVLIPLARYDEEVKCPHCDKTLQKIFSPCMIKVR